MSNYNNLSITIFSITTLHLHLRRVSLSNVLLFYANSESITQTQQNFCWHFNVLPCGRIPDRNTILRWMRDENKLLKKKPSKGKSKVIPQETSQDPIHNFREHQEKDYPIRRPPSTQCSFYYISIYKIFLKLQVYI